MSSDFRFFFLLIQFLASISLINKWGKKNRRDLRRVLDRRGLSPGLDWGDDLHTHTREHTQSLTHRHIYTGNTQREREREGKKNVKKKKKREEGARFLLQTPPINGEAPPSCCSEQRRGRCGQFHREMTLCAKSTVGYTSNLSPIVMFSKECFRPLLKCRPFPYQKCH